MRVTIPSALLKSCLTLSLVLLSAVSPRAHAQGILVRGATTVRFVELRPYVDDSVPLSATTPGAVDYRQLPDGRVVRCVEGDAYCRFKRGGDVANTMPVLQDIQISAWGLGRGISMHSDMRLRGAFGEQPYLWPRANDNFDLLTAYLQWDRSRFTVRAGRQYAISGLGVYNFDGASVVVRPSKKLSVEAFGGWSLAQGLNESLTTSEIAAVDELPPDRNAYLVGAQVRVNPSDNTTLQALYQREVRDNRSALYSERVALDGSWRFAGAALEGAYTQDLAANVVNELRVRLRSPTVRQATLSVEARRFRPFFPLWTIWGAFAPVGFDEARMQASWNNRAQTLTLDVHGAKRKWEDTDAGLDFQPLRSEGWRIGGGFAWRAATTVFTSASYSADVGFGAARSEADAAVHWEHGRLLMGVMASVFQSIYEFRIGTGRVFGFGGDIGWNISPDLRLVSDAMLYQQQAKNGAPSGDWNQRRASMRLEWTIGSDPGMSTVSAAARKAAARERADAELKRVAAAHAGRLPAAAGAPEIRP
jgi:hypothetical protein